MDTENEKTDKNVGSPALQGIRLGSESVCTSRPQSAFGGSERPKSYKHLRSG